MKTLLLNFSGPLQSWGTDSRFHRRATGVEPSKSGVLGLLAAAQGRPRTAELGDLAALSMAVRVDRSGELVEDFHTARAPGGKHSALSHRHYRSDAAYTVAVAGEESLVEALRCAILSPAFPLYLGRRACPVPPNLLGGVIEADDAEAVLRDLDVAPWQASEAYREQQEQVVFLPISRDARPGEVGEVIYDSPVSFNPEHRKYAARMVVRCDPVKVENPQGTASADPFFQLAKEA